ncbi:hypothetical protein [Pseudomonas cerasi]
MRKKCRFWLPTRARFLPLVGWRVHPLLVAFFRLQGLGHTCADGLKQVTVQALSTLSGDAEHRQF